MEIVHSRRIKNVWSCRDNPLTLRLAILAPPAPEARGKHPRASEAIRTGELRRAPTWVQPSVEAIRAQASCGGARLGCNLLWRRYAHRRAAAGSDLGATFAMQASCGGFRLGCSLLWRRYAHRLRRGSDLGATFCGGDTPGRAAAGLRLGCNGLEARTEEAAAGFALSELLQCGGVLTLERASSDWTRARAIRDGSRPCALA